MAVISDIHGNLPALRAVVAEVRSTGVDQILCCGDIASGPLPAETIDFLRSLDVPFRSVRGNADRCAVASFDGRGDPSTMHEDDLWAGRQLDRQQRDWLADLPATMTVEVARFGSVLLCHGSPRRDDEILLETTSSEHLSAALHDVDARVVLCGNTHMQFERRVGDLQVVNVGSVGWPYGGTGAYWALLGTRLELRRTDYDLDDAIQELRRRSTWPRIEVFLANLPSPPPKERALAFFRQIAEDIGSGPDGPRRRDPDDTWM